LRKKTLELPLGIKLWNSELRRNKKQLCEGYTFSLLENTTDSYRFTIAASADRIPALFREFCGDSIDEAFLILEYYRTEQPVAKGGPVLPDVYYSPYLPVDELFAIIDPYLPRLIHDGFVGFGLANNRSGTEIFYSEEKILSCFTDNHIRTMDQLHQHGIEYGEEMLYHTDLGHDHLSLLCHPDNSLPEQFSKMSDTDLDFVRFCDDLSEKLGMYAVEETLSFFLSRREQDMIENCLAVNPDFSEVAAEDFGSILLDWNDFVAECEDGFKGNLEDYRLGLHLRDIIDHVIAGTEPELGQKIREIIADPDSKFRRILVDCRQRLDNHHDGGTTEKAPFWYQGIVENQGADLRRDLIRHGWYKPNA